MLTNKSMVLLALTLGSGVLFAQQDSISGNDNIYLQLKPLELNSVIVFSEKNGDSRSSNAPALVELQHTANIDEILEKSTAVQMVKRGGYAFEPVINGLNGGQLPVTINGMRIFAACTDKMDPITSYVETNNLDEAQVSCTSSSTKNGSGMGAALDLITQRPQLSDTVRLDGHWFGGIHSVNKAYHTGLDFNLSKKKLAFKGSMAIRNANNYRDGNHTIVRYTQYQKQNLAGNLRYRPNNVLLIDVDYIYDKATDIGYAALPMDVSLAESHITSVTGSYYPKAASIEKVTAKAYANRIVHVMDDTKRLPEEVTMHMDMPGWSNTQGFFLESHFILSTKNKLFAKADYYHNYQFSEMIMYPDNEQPMYMVTWPGINRHAEGIYVEDSHTFNEQWNAKISARFELNQTSLKDTFGIQQLEVFDIDGRISYQHLPYSVSAQVEHTVNSIWSLFLGSGYHLRAPNSSEMYGYFLFNKSDGYDYIGTPDIRMEKGANVWLRTKINTKKTVIELEGKYQQIEDYIYGWIDPSLSQMTIGANGTKKYVNLDFVRLLSTHAIWEQKLNQYFALNSRLQLTLGEKYDGEPLPQISPFSYGSRLDFKSGSYLASLEVEGALKQNRVDPSFVEYPSSDWTILNLRFVKSWSLKKGLDVSVQTGIENLTNNYYYRHLDWGKIARPGRNFYLNLKLSF